LQFFHARQQASHVFTNTQQRRGVSKIEIKELQKRKEFLTLIKFRRRKEKTGEKIWKKWMKRRRKSAHL
jgi:type IV secretory pathway component VirB8